jgi:hypothetical protein
MHLLKMKVVWHHQCVTGAPQDVQNLHGKVLSDVLMVPDALDVHSQGCAGAAPLNSPCVAIKRVIRLVRQPLNLPCRKLVQQLKYAQNSVAIVHHWSAS